MKHRVICAICEKSEVIEIKNGGRIPKDWWYFGEFNIASIKTSKYFYEIASTKPKLVTKKIKNKDYDGKVKPKFIEYWEHRKCAK